MRAYDPNNNYCSATLVVTVLEASMTNYHNDYRNYNNHDYSFTNHRYNPNGVDPLMILIIGAGIVGVVVIVVVVVFLKKRS